jgi:hypothetical protein
MKKFFWVMLVASLASVLYEFDAELGVMAHNQYRGRHDLLDRSRPQPNHLSPHLGLTQTELGLCDKYVADAYGESVYDGYRLGRGYSRLSRQCLIMAGLLFVTSFIGIRSSSGCVDGCSSGQIC